MTFSQEIVDKKRTLESVTIGFINLSTRRKIYEQILVTVCETVDKSRETVCKRKCAMSLSTTLWIVLLKLGKKI